MPMDDLSFQHFSKDSRESQSFNNSINNRNSTSPSVSPIEQASVKESALGKISRVIHRFAETKPPTFSEMLTFVEDKDDKEEEEELMGKKSILRQIVEYYGGFSKRREKVTAADELDVLLQETVQSLSPMNPFSLDFENDEGI
jgi:hypothetical protein